jgi:hypothetical protein
MSNKGLPREQDEMSCDVFDTRGVEVAEGDTQFLSEVPHTRTSTNENQQRQK